MVFKIVPLEGDLIVNGEHQKKSEDITAEAAIAATLSDLREKPGKPACAADPHFQIYPPPSPFLRLTFKASFRHCCWIGLARHVHLHCISVRDSFPAACHVRLILSVTILSRLHDSPDPKQCDALMEGQPCSCSLILQAT